MTVSAGNGINIMVKNVFKLPKHYEFKFLLDKLNFECVLTKASH